MKRNISDKRCRENQNTHFTVNAFFFFKSYCLRDNVENRVQPGRPQIWRMRIACWVPKATDTHSEFVILIAFLLQQLLNERASILRSTYIACHVESYALAGGKEPFV